MSIVLVSFFFLINYPRYVTNILFQAVINSVFLNFVVTTIDVSDNETYILFIKNIYIEPFKYPNFGFQDIEKHRSRSSKQGLKTFKVFLIERTHNWRFLRNTYHSIYKRNPKQGFSVWSILH